MAKWGKVGIILAAVLTIACIALGVMYYQENEIRVTLEKNLKQVLEEKNALQENINKKEQAITRLKQNIEKNQFQFKSSLEEKDAELITVSQELAGLKEQQTNLKIDFSKLKDLRFKLENKLSQAKAEKEKLLVRLSDKEKKNELLLLKLGRSGENETALTLEKIVVQQPPRWQGKILAVDNKYGYAVLGLGMKKGLPENIFLGIFRGEENIGRAKVLKLYENTSVVQIIKQDREILESDLIKSIPGGINSDF